MDMTQPTFQDAMATLASSVSILTTNGPAGLYGITVTALTSVTNTPPTFLACVNRSGIANQIFKTNNKICANVLNSSQISLGQHYASGQEQQKQFDNLHWYIQQDRPPELKEANAIIQGTVASVQEYGSHSIFFIEVDTIKCTPDPDALVYFQRKYIKIPR
jgi:Conserved protein/domain typically associated with flavoprotein oxygenases, DIM6/NTAB family